MGNQEVLLEKKKKLPALVRTWRGDEHMALKSDHAASQ